jgi:four helix bundle protein
MKSDSTQNEATTNDSKEANGRTAYRFGVYDDAIALCRLVRSLAALIERHDRKMAAQLRTAASSVVLNTAEGAGRRGGHQRERLSAALWSSREVKANLEASEALGYLAASDIASAAADKADKICATLWKCLHR